MLQSIHDKAKGWVAYLIVGFIAVPFALFGISSYLGGSNTLVAATVNGEEIPVTEVQNIVLQQRQRMAQIFGGKLPPGFSADALKSQALEQVVSQVLLRQQAEENGYRASNQEVYDTISEIPAFQRNGQFDSQAYEQLLRSQRRNKSGFEAEIRSSLSNQQFPAAINKSAFIPVEDLKHFQRLQNQERDCEIYTLKKSDFIEQVSVTEDEIQKQYDQNQSSYMTKEKLKLSYVHLKQDDIARTISPDDDQLNAFYDENLSRYITPEQRKLAHILIKIDAEAVDQAKAEADAKDKAENLLKQIKDGSKSFEELATTESDDDLASKNNGEIGLIAKGDMGALFEKEAFALNKGDVTDVVKTEAGFEIIKLLDVTGAVQKSFDEVKDEVLELYRSEEAEKLFLDQSDKLQTLAFENESSLDEAADAVGAKVLTSDWIERGAIPNSDNVLTNEKVVSAAFSADVLEAGKNSEMIELDDASVVIIRLQDHQVPKQKPLSEVTDLIKNNLEDQKLRKILITKGESILQALKASNDWSSLGEINVNADKVEASKALKRNDTSLPPSIISKLFSMQKPAPASKTFDSTILPSGDYALIALTNVKEGDDKFDQSLQQSFTQMIASREQAAMLKALREQAEVELFPENIQ